MPTVWAAPPVAIAASRIVTTDAAVSAFVVVRSVIRAFGSLPSIPSQSLLGILPSFLELRFAGTLELHGVWLQPKWVTEIDGIAAREAIEVEAAGQADGIFLRKSPDRTYNRTPQRRKHADLYFEATDVAEGARTVKFVWKAGLRPLLTPLNTAISKYAKHLAKGAAQGAVISAAGGESPVPTTWSDFLNGAVEAATPGGSIPHQVQHVADVCGNPSGTP